MAWGLRTTILWALRRISGDPVEDDENIFLVDSFDEDLEPISGKDCSSPHKNHGTSFQDFRSTCRIM